MSSSHHTGAPDHPIAANDLVTSSAVLYQEQQTRACTHPLRTVSNYATGQTGILSFQEMAPKRIRFTCPVCGSDNGQGAQECRVCDHVFSMRQPAIPRIPAPAPPTQDTREEDPSPDVIPMELEDLPPDQEAARAAPLSPIEEPQRAEEPQPVQVPPPPEPRRLPAEIPPPPLHAPQEEDPEADEHSSDHVSEQGGMTPPDNGGQDSDSQDGDWVRRMLLHAEAHPDGPVADWLHAQEDMRDREERERAARIEQLEHWIEPALPPVVQQSRVRHVALGQPPWRSHSRAAGAAQLPEQQPQDDPLQRGQDPEENSPRPQRRRTQ